MTARNLVALALLAAAIGCSDTERAKNAAKDANDDVAEERKDVQEAAKKLDEEEGELREAQASADARAVKLENEVSKDTAAKKP